jgi:hypothetical protein
MVVLTTGAHLQAAGRLGVVVGVGGVRRAREKVGGCVFLSEMSSTSAQICHSVQVCKERHPL